MQAKLSPNDRIVQFGDGFFTTAKLINGRFILLKQHLERLKESADRLLFNSFNENVLRDEILKVTSNIVGNNIVKIIISRGNSKIGYSFNKSSCIKRIILITPMPKYYLNWRKNGISLGKSPIRLSRNPLLAGIKHNNRLEQVLIRHHLDNTNTDETLVLDTSNFIIECCSANIFWRKGKKIFTPSLKYAGVNGIIRRLIISILLKFKYEFTEVNSTIDELKFADEVFITNALLPIVPVHTILNKRYYDRSLCLKLNDYIQEIEHQYA